MGEIKYLANQAISKQDSIDRIVAAAKANGGLWLMVKERAMEMRVFEAELRRLGAGTNDMDGVFPTRLTPTIAELAEELVSALFGSCPPEVVVFVESALLAAARIELNASEK